MPRITRLASVVFIGVLLAGCSSGASPSASPTAAATPSAAPTVSASPSPTPNPCAKESLQTLTAGKLTVGADNPAFPPYFDTDPKDPAWETGNPKNGKGLESATAYAAAKQLGFSEADVVWVPVPFNNAVQPGKKAFDMYLTQVSYSAERAKAVDLSDGYFDLNQAVVALKGTPIASVTTVAGLKDFRLGTQGNTTAFTYITNTIQPTKEPRAYDSLDAALAGLKAKQIEGIVADLPTAFYMTAAQLDNKGVIVGSLPTVGEVEHFSILLNLGSPLTSCVNTALAAIKADGTLPGIVKTYITDQGAPELK